MLKLNNQFFKKDMGMNQFFELWLFKIFKKKATEKMSWLFELFIYLFVSKVRVL